MDKTAFRQILLQQFSHEPTMGQAALINKISRFCTEKESANVFVLKGYAGTGKTTIISALIRSLPAIQLKSVLLAPTGRAAKILSNYSGKQGFTIHKKIYKRLHNADGSGRFIVQPNLHTHTFFIVDEASMISNSGGLSGNFSDQSSLLDDLIGYVSSGVNCKLILIGDTAQLPPVGLSISPALDIEHLKSVYSFTIDSIELNEVMRQEEGSGILANATGIRNLISQGIAHIPRFTTDPFKDIVRLTGNDLEDALNNAYHKYGVDGTAVICRSNKRANQYNQQIRARIRWQESELSAGDFMMAVKNNYHWLPEESKAGFIANGDIIELLKVSSIKEQYGFRFVDATIRMVDYPGEPSVEVKLILDSISSETPSLTSEQNKKLYEEVLKDYAEIPDRRKRMAELKKDPFFNALQVKFAYAITCHKAQGGQWETVFVDQGYLTKEMINIDFLRWLYTASTRATKKLYLLNFNKEFFGEDGDY
jgi:ATP-dependent exoDNAse (exonuclease V) alpha subunit